MKIYYRPKESVTLELEASNVKDMFEKLAQVEEIFQQNKCQKCNGQHITMQVREVDENKFYEMRCLDCHAVLAFGAHKKGNTLFPKRFTEDEGERAYLDNKGWTRWDKDAQKRV